MENFAPNIRPLYNPGEPEKAQSTNHSPKRKLIHVSLKISSFFRLIEKNYFYNNAYQLYIPVSN